MIRLQFPGPVLHMKRIGENPDHQALRARNEQRLAALKASKRLYEDKNEPTTGGNQAAQLAAYNQLSNAGDRFAGCTGISGSDLYGLGTNIDNASQWGFGIQHNR